MQHVIDLLDIAAKNYPVKALAPEIGKAESTLRNELTQQDGYKLGLLTAYQILKITKDYRALDRLERLLGRVAFSPARRHAGQHAGPHGIGGPPVEGIRRPHARNRKSPERRHNRQRGGPQMPQGTSGDDGRCGAIESLPGATDLSVRKEARHDTLCAFRHQDRDFPGIPPMGGGTIKSREGCHGGQQPEAPHRCVRQKMAFNRETRIGYVSSWGLTWPR